MEHKTSTFSGLGIKTWKIGKNDYGVIDAYKNRYGNVNIVLVTDDIAEKFHKSGFKDKSLEYILDNIKKAVRNNKSVVNGNKKIKLYCFNVCIDERSAEKFEDKLKGDSYWIKYFSTTFDRGQVNDLRSLEGYRLDFIDMLF